VLVVKTPRLPGGGDGLKREAARLQAAQAVRAGGFDSLPRVVALDEHFGRPLLVQTALVGQPIEEAHVRRQPGTFVRDVLQWLADVQLPSRRAPALEPDWQRRLIDAPLARLATAFPLSFEEHRLLEQLAELVKPLRGAAMPLVLEHGDLSPPNVMRLRGGGMGVVDWELSDPRGLPLADLFFSLTYAAFCRHDVRRTGQHAQAYHDAFFGPAAWAAPYVIEHAQRLGVPHVCLTPLLALSWARYLSGLLERMGEGGPSPVRSETAAWLRSNRYYSIWRHTLDHSQELAW
jgi:aminoglycoside phosphotransferase (APT) family kinase protein